VRLDVTGAPWNADAVTTALVKRLPDLRAAHLRTAPGQATCDVSGLHDMLPAPGTRLCELSNLGALSVPMILDTDLGDGTRYTALRALTVSRTTAGLGVFLPGLTRLCLGFDGRADVPDNFAMLDRCAALQSLDLTLHGVSLGYTSPLLCTLLSLLVPPRLPALTALRLTQGTTSGRCFLATPSRAPA
jgi:hypothetical protein